MAKSHPGKVAGTVPIRTKPVQFVPITTPSGSGRWHFAWPDLKSVAKFGVISLVSFVPASCLSFGEQVGKAALTAGIGAAVGTLIKFLQRFVSDTR